MEVALLRIATNYKKMLIKVKLENAKYVKNSINLTIVQIIAKLKTVKPLILKK